MIGKWDKVQIGQSSSTVASTMFRSTGWGKMDFTKSFPGEPDDINGDLLKGIKTGNDVRTRIGNKITPRYLQGAITFTAAMVNRLDSGADETDNNHGEQMGGVPTRAFMRTTYRCVIVKDLQVNSTDTEIDWNQVFETGSGGTGNGSQGGVHSELNIGNMGRFFIMYDRTFTLDADDPQKTCKFKLRGSSIGTVRYNGPSEISLTDKGIHVIWAAYTVGTAGDSGTVDNAGDTIVSPPTMNSRLCFIDS